MTRYFIVQGEWEPGVTVRMPESNFRRLGGAVAAAIEISRRENVAVEVWDRGAGRGPQGYTPIEELFGGSLVGRVGVARHGVFESETLDKRSA